MGYIFGLLDSIITTFIAGFFFIVVLIIIDSIAYHVKGPIR